MLQGCCGESRGLPQSTKLSFEGGAGRHTVQDIIGTELNVIIQIEIPCLQIDLGQVEISGGVLFVSRLVDICLFRVENAAFFCQLPPGITEIKIP